MTKHERYRAGYVEGVTLAQHDPLTAVPFARGYLSVFVGDKLELAAAESARGLADGVMDELEGESNEQAHARTA